MPHLIFDSSPGLLSNSVKQDLLDQCVVHFSQFETIEAKNVKARFFESSCFSMGEGAGDSYLHLTISVIEGRSPEVLDHLGRGMHQFLITLLASAKNAQQTNITLELRQMAQASYYKN